MVNGIVAWPGLHACSLLCGWPTSLLSGPGLDNPNYPSGTSVSQCSLMHTRHFQGKKGITQKDTETKTQALNCHGRDILKNVQEGGPQDKWGRKQGWVLHWHWIFLDDLGHESKTKVWLPQNGNQSLPSWPSSARPIPCWLIQNPTSPLISWPAMTCKNGPWSTRYGMA